MQSGFLFSVSVLGLGFANATPSPADARTQGAVDQTGATQTGTMESSPQTGPSRTAAIETEEADPHENDEIIVTGALQRTRDNLLTATSVLTGEALVRDMRLQIGDTLARQPGVSASSFGPNASRPVLRGLQGDRVRVLTDGIGAFDASSTSVDHAVMVNPLTAERVEVLRGPASLQFGSSAIGGVVNVIDRRIPMREPKSGVRIDGVSDYSSASRQGAFNGAVDARVMPDVVVHIDGSYARAHDLRTGGHILAPALREQALASEDPNVRALADLKKRLPNSWAKNWDIAGSAAYIGNKGQIGGSVAHLQTRYALPIRYAIEPGAEAEKVHILARQTRYDVRGEIDTNGWINSIRLRAGAARYRHSEIDEDGIVGTRFRTRGMEGRLEAVQRAQGGWSGASGVQYFHRRLSAEGDEAFLPRNRDSQIGLFTVQTLTLNRWILDGGLRWEHSRARARGLTAFETELQQEADANGEGYDPRRRRHFNVFSGSLGAAYQLVQGLHLGVSGTHSERAPTPEELFAYGPHAGTAAFEIGNPDFRKEKSNGLELGLRYDKGGNHLHASVYRNWFKDYIYHAPTDRIEDGLPVYIATQKRARFTGFEIDGSATLGAIGSTQFVLDGLMDYTRARIVHHGNAPQIPPLRLLGGVEARRGAFDARLEVERVSHQHRTAVNETRTKGYTMVNANLVFHPFASHPNTQIQFSADNLFNVVARRATSVLKDYAPLAGRDIRVTLKFAL